MRRLKPWLAILATALTFCGAAAACDDPIDNVGDRCTRTSSCTPPLICSNRDAPDELGICVYPEALPDAAVTPDASTTPDASSL